MARVVIGVIVVNMSYPCIGIVISVILFIIVGAAFLQIALIVNSANVIMLKIWCIDIFTIV